MKKKYLLSIAFSALALLSNAPSFAQRLTQCKPVEFAEMQTFNKDELTALYCKHQRLEKAGMKLQEIEEEMAILQARLGVIKEAEKSMKEGKEYGLDAGACRTEIDRVGRLLERQRVATISLKCE